MGLIDNLVAAAKQLPSVGAVAKQGLEAAAVEGKKIPKVMGPTAQTLLREKSKPTPAPAPKKEVFADVMKNPVAEAIKGVNIPTIPTQKMGDDFLGDLWKLPVNIFTEVANLPIRGVNSVKNATVEGVQKSLQGSANVAEKGPIELPNAAVEAASTLLTGRFAPAMAALEGAASSENPFIKGGADIVNKFFEGLGTVGSAAEKGLELGYEDVTGNKVNPTVSEGLSRAAALGAQVVVPALGAKAVPKIMGAGRSVVETISDPVFLNAAQKSLYEAGRVNERTMPSGGDVIKPMQDLIAAARSGMDAREIARLAKELPLKNPSKEGSSQVFRAGDVGNYFSTSKEYIQQGGWTGNIRSANIPTSAKILDATNYKKFTDLVTPADTKLLTSPNGKVASLAKQAILERNGYDGMRFSEEGQNGKAYESVFLTDKLSPDFAYLRERAAELELVQRDVAALEGKTARSSIEQTILDAQKARLGELQKEPTAGGTPPPPTPPKEPPTPGSPEGFPIKRPLSKITEALPPSLKGAYIKARELFDDSMIRQRMLEAQPEIKVSEATSPYRTEQRFYGRLDTRLQEARAKVDEIVSDVFKDAKGNKISPEQLFKDMNDYAKAKHAPERNAMDKSAGITNEQAAAQLKALQEGPTGELVAKGATKIQELSKTTLDVLEQYELITPELAKSLREKYPNHVPLNRIMPEDISISDGLTGAGKTLAGKNIKAAKGSELDVQDIFGNVVHNLQEAITRGEKNIYGKSIGEFAKDNIDTGLFEISTKKPVRDTNTITYYEKGVPQYIEIKDPQLATALKGLNLSDASGFFKFFQPITRFYASMATKYNPDFILPNKIRDVQDTFLSGLNNLGVRGAVKQVGKDLNQSSMKAVIDYKRGVETPESKLYKQMLEDGGTTGGLSLSTRGQTQVDLQSLKESYQGGAWNSSKNALKGLGNAIDAMQDVVENSTRFSAYKTAIEQGMSREAAAIYSKNASVNFNKKGTLGPQMGAVKMFANASIQGMKNSVRFLANPKVAIPIMAAVTGATYKTDQWNDSIDPQWREKVSQQERDSNLVVLTGMRPDGTPDYIKIPTSYTLKPIKIGANLLSDQLAGKKKGAIDGIREAAFSIADVFNFTGSTRIEDVFTPTAVQWLSDIGKNKNFMGYDIKPADEEVANYEKYFPSLEKKFGGKQLIDLTNQVFQSTGGGVDISPADILYGMEQTTGGVGRFLQRGLTSGQAIAKGETPAAKDTPILNRFFGSISPEQFEKAIKNRSFDDLYKALRGVPKDDRAPLIQSFILRIPNEEDRKSAIFRIMQSGFETKGVVQKVENLVKEKEKGPTPSGVQSSVTTAGKSAAVAQKHRAELNGLIDQIPKIREKGYTDEQIIDTILANTKDNRYDKATLQYVMELEKAGQRIELGIEPRDAAKAKVVEKKKEIEEFKAKKSTTNQ